MGQEPQVRSRVFQHVDYFHRPRTGLDRLRTFFRREPRVRDRYPSSEDDAPRVEAYLATDREEPPVRVGSLDEETDRVNARDPTFP